MKTYWFAALMSSICLEGLGRRYLPGVPSIAFYLLKDLVLIAGFLIFRPQPAVQRVSSYLFRGYTLVWFAAFGWTVFEIVNPELGSLLLAGIGMRAYWLWWIAPPIVATALQNVRLRRRAIFFLAFLAIGISALAMLQFVAPPDSAINVYSVVGGEELHASEAGLVYSTGRARVSSTFSFISGFSDFTVLVPALLLSLGLETTDRRLRTVSLLAVAFCVISSPMSGSRASVLLGGAVIFITCWSAGLFLTRAGRRILVGGLVGIVVAGILFPDALFGIQSRFENSEETASRIVLAAAVIPPVALATLDYPMMGLGTGSMQNYAFSLPIPHKFVAEIEVHRYLVELGPIGFFLAWSVKLGLMVAFYRASKLLKKAGRRAGAGAALSYAAVTFFGNLTFDHVWQSLYFVGAGFILAETKAAVDILRERARTAQPAAAGPPPVSLRA
jgi:hypothetical protein